MCTQLNIVLLNGWIPNGAHPQEKGRAFDIFIVDRLLHTLPGFAWMYSQTIAFGEGLLRWRICFLMKYDVYWILWYWESICVWTKEPVFMWSCWCIGWSLFTLFIVLHHQGCKGDFNSIEHMSQVCPSVFFFPKLNYFIFGYFDPVNLIFDNKNN